MKTIFFVIKQIDNKECSPSCSFYSYEGVGCRIGVSDGYRRPTIRCPGNGIYKLIKMTKEELLANG
jgi:hypothetical protein